MSADTFRELCAELTEKLHEHTSLYDGHESQLVAHARTLLAQPEPVALTDEELLAVLDNATANFPPLHPEAEPLNAVEYPLALELRKARAVEAAVLARRPTPPPPADGELTVNLRMDLSSECLKRLCDGLAAAVKPNGGYRELTTDDDTSGEFIGEQLVGVEWWLPEHGCDSLENTLDSIKGRLRDAVQDWLPTAMTSTPQPPADEELLELAAKALGYKSIPSDETDLEADAGELLAFARAVEAAVLARQAPPNLAETRRSPADGEVAELVAWLRLTADEQPHTSGQGGIRLTRAAELLQRQHPQPVPVSERLPGPGDLHPTDQWCWVCGQDCCAWHRVTHHFDAWSYWLPAHALPVPTSENV